MNDLNMEAAALQRVSGRDLLVALLQAKRESDRRNYAAKAAILRQLLRSNTDEFAIDSENNGILGLTHKSKFRIHLPKDQIPAGIALQPLTKPDPGIVPSSLTKSAAEPEWDVRVELEKALDEYGDILLALKEASVSLPPATTLYFNPDKGVVHTDNSLPPGFYTEPWALVKRAFSPTVKAVTDVAGLTPGPANEWYGGPRPLAAMLAGGLVGAGTGYLGGALAEGVTGNVLEKGRLRKTLALMGGLAGAAPGAYWAANNATRMGPRGLVSPWPTQPDVEADSFPKAALHALLPDCKPETAFAKAGAVAGADAGGPINADAFGRVIWSREDPFTPANLRAGASGLVDAAAAMRGGSSSIIWPSDIMRVAIGMGSGYAMGTLAGRTLGVLAGLSSDAQRELQRAGTWAGVLKTVIPSAFGSP